jgi:hypothetical protein
MKKNLFLSTPRATGDHIICNALYRNLVKDYEICIFPVKKSIFLNVSSMLSDIKNIEYMIFPDKITRRATKVASYLFEKMNFKIARIGWDGENFPLKIPMMTWDMNFYHQFSLNFDLRWEGFYAPRNHFKEKHLFNLLKCNEGPYAFVHEDKSRNFNVNRNYISSNLRIINSNPMLKNFSIFDYRLALEKASEIHCIEGSFSALIESISVQKPLFAHRYARPETLRDPWHQYQYRQNWKIII